MSYKLFKIGKKSTTGCEENKNNCIIHTYCYMIFKDLIKVYLKVPWMHTEPAVRDSKKSSVGLNEDPTVSFLHCDTEGQRALLFEQAHAKKSGFKLYKFTISEKVRRDSSFSGQLM